MGAVWEVHEAIQRYLESAESIVSTVDTEADRRVAALNAIQPAASFVTDSSWYEEWGNLASVQAKLYFETNAIRYDDDDAERYFEALETFDEALAAKYKTSAKHQLAWAEFWVASDRITWRDNQ